MLLTQNTSLLFFGGRSTSLTECLRSWIDVGEKYLSHLVLKDFLLVPRKGRIPWCWHTLATLAQTPCGVEKLKFSFYVLFSSPPQHRLDSPKPRDLLEPEPCAQNWWPVCQAVWGFLVSPLRWSPSKEQWFLAQTVAPQSDTSAFFISISWKSGVGLWKVVKQHAKCGVALTLNFPCSEHHMKISLVL